MSFVHFAKREIQFKIVYYGCGLSGKTTNLEVVHQTIKPDSKGEMISVATSGDRTLFFDFMPLVAEAIEGYKTHFQLYTVPGQVMYGETRRLVLRGVDGLVFVADSQWDKMAENVESFEDLVANLAGQGDNIDEMPYILQYNKRDLPNIAPSHYMDFVLNDREERRASMLATATTGQGVFECLNMICRLVLHKFMEEHVADGQKSEAELVLV